MPYPWHNRKIRGAKKKEQAKQRKKQRDRRADRQLSETMKRIRQRMNEDPVKAAKRKKRTCRHMAFLSKAWGIRKRLLVGWYESERGRRNRRGRFDTRDLFLAYREKERRDWPKERKIRACYIWSD